MSHCCFYSGDVEGKSSCPLNFRIQGRDKNPCHMEEEGKTPEWEKCSYNHPIVKKAIQKVAAALPEAKAPAVSP